MEPLRRTSRDEPCPCCGKPDWCSFNSRIAVCMRVPSDRPTRPDGQVQGWIHLLDGRRRPLDLPPGRPYQRIAPVPARHLWYTALSKALGLSLEHQEALRQRGFDDAFIRRNGYSTLPPPNTRQNIVADVMQRMGTDPGHIPGFYQDETGRWCLAGSQGLLVPIRDENFLIQGFQVRRPDAQVARDHGPRYVWLSSAGDQRLANGYMIKRQNGTSSGAPLHHQRRPGAPLWVTEGPLKADLLHHAWGVSTIALPGVGNWRPLLVDPMASTHRTELIVIAFDRDQNPCTVRYVAQAKTELAAALYKRGLPTKDAIWSDVCKGIDDAIRASVEVHLRSFYPDRTISR